MPARKPVATLRLRRLAAELRRLRADAGLTREEVAGRTGINEATLYRIEAAKAGHDVIMTPYSDTYLDYYQSEDRASEPVRLGKALLDAMHRDARATIAVTLLVEGIHAERDAAPDPPSPSHTQGCAPNPLPPPPLHRPSRRHHGPSAIVYRPSLATSIRCRPLTGFSAHSVF